MEQGGATSWISKMMALAARAVKIHPVPNLFRLRQQINRVRGAHHHGEEIRHWHSTSDDALVLFPQQINRARGAHHHGEEIQH